MNATAEKPLIDLSWVAAAGGPEIKCEDGRHVTGLPEEGWWVWSDAEHKDQSEGLELKLHRDLVEPETGQAGTLIVSLNPVKQEVRWDACFMWSQPGSDWDVCVPVRGSGLTSDFESAYKAALEWRPIVQVIDGIELWADPVSMNGVARDLQSGDLAWLPSTGPDGCINWRFKPAGLSGLKELGLFDWRDPEVEGYAHSHQQMLDQVAEAREQMRAAMRKFLLNF